MRYRNTLMYVALPLFATRFAACIGGTVVSFIAACLFKLILNGVHERFMTHIYSDEIYVYIIQSICVWNPGA